MSRRLPAVLAVLLVSCTSPRRAPPLALSAEPPDMRPSGGVAPVPVPGAALPSAEPTSPRNEHCDVKLPNVTFSECYTKPRTLHYPDCRQYAVERIDHDSTCRPERLRLTITGYQSIAEIVDVKVVWEAGMPRKARLALDRLVSSILPYDEKQGTALGTILFEGGAPRKLLIGPGLRSYTDQPSAQFLE